MMHNAYLFGRGRERAVRRWLLSSASSLSALTLLAVAPASPALAQTAPQGENQPSTLPQVSVTTNRAKPPTPGRSGQRGTTSAKPPPPTSSTQTPAAPAGTGAGGVPAPGINLDAIATSASRLGLTVRETPRTVEVVDRQTIEQQGYRTNMETAAGAVGVLAVDVGGAQGGFSMRGFEFDQLNILYNGISAGPQDLTGRTMSTFSFQQVEFLKGASALESGLGAIGGSVNYVSRLPTSGPIQNEAYISWDSLNSIRSGWASSGSTPVKGLDYVFTVDFDHVNGFIDDTNRNLSSLTTRFNYQVSEDFKTWVAFEYYKDAGHQYWGTPIVPVSFAGPFATSGIVSGVATSHEFNQNFLGPVTIDSRTLTTNYNSLDNYDQATSFWGRGGFEWQVAPNVTFKDQTYVYAATRTFFDAEFNAFDTATGSIQQGPFFVSHNQHLFGNIADVTWDSAFLGMPNRLAGEFAASRNQIVFGQSSNSSTDHVSVVDPSRVFFGPLITDTVTGLTDTVYQSLEDRLKITPEFALIGGVRVDEIFASESGLDSTGAQLFTPASATWSPVSYRIGATWEPIHNTTFYGLYGTSYDPAIGQVFELPPDTPLVLTSSKIYEAGVKQSVWGNRLEWTFAVYDLTRRNVLQQISDHPVTFGVAGEIDTKGIEISSAARPIEGLTLWGNVALTDARFGSDVFTVSGTVFDFTGNTPPNVAPVIANAGASYRFEKQEWWHWLPTEFGVSARYVGNRFVFADNQVTMDAYTTYDAYMFIDFNTPSLLSKFKQTRLSLRARNLTNATYAAYTDPGTPDQIYLGAPRTYEAAMSFKW